MKINEEKIDDMVLALMYLGLHDNGRSWKTFDWDSLNRLHEKIFIFNPVNKAKSVLLTEEGAKLAEQFFKKHFEVKDTKLTKSC